MELTVIDRSDLQQHRSLSGSVRLPWRTGCLGGSVQVLLIHPSLDANDANV